MARRTGHRPGAHPAVRPLRPLRRAPGRGRSGRDRVSKPTWAGPRWTGPAWTGAGSIAPGLPPAATAILRGSRP